MEMNINIGYDEILELIHQLPKRDIERLVLTLNSEISSKKSSESIDELILQAPTWSESELKEYQESREYINNSRLS